MDSEENANIEQNRIKELLEEAAKRHREIEEKIHPEKFDINISKSIDDKKTEYVIPVKDSVYAPETKPEIDIPPVDQVKPIIEFKRESDIETTEQVKHVFESKSEAKAEQIEQALRINETEPVMEIKSALKIMPEAHDSPETEPELVEQSKDIEEILPFDAPDLIEFVEKPVKEKTDSGSDKNDEEISPIEVIDISSKLKEVSEEDELKIIMNSLNDIASRHAVDTDDLVKSIETDKINKSDSSLETPVEPPELSIMLETPKVELINIAKDNISSTDSNISSETNEKIEAGAKTDSEISQVSDESIVNVETTEPIEQTPEPFITEFDLHLFSKGTFYRIFEKFGAQLHTENEIGGVCFTTWAPNAEKVYLIGEFNGWRENEDYQLKRIHNDLGIWSAFFPGIKEGDTYKYSIKSKVDKDLRRKGDPYAFRSEVRPKNASIVANINKYTWQDENWMCQRANESFKSKPMNIFEVHLGSWRRNYNNTEFPNEWGYLSYSQLAHEIVDHVKKMGYTHIELLPVMEHPLDISWGYQVTHYYAPTSRFGQPEDFMYFVDYCHQNGIGVILDWVPAHFPYDEHALAYFDGKQIYAYENLKRGYSKDWGTFIFDYGKPEVQNFLIGSALFWLEKYHADGLRVDAVASMLYLDYSRDQGDWEPNIHGGREHLEAINFLKHLNSKVHEYHKGALMIAEESTSWPGVSHPLNDGGLGFDMKWNMGWMNDILLYFSKDPVYRKFHQGKITFSLWYAFSENFVLPISHDEVVHGKKSLLEKMPGDNWQKFANMRLFLGFMTGHPGKKLNFMTTDIAQYDEWNCETAVEWNLLDLDLNKKLNLFVQDLNRLYTNHPALFEIDFESDGFRWIDFSDSLHSVLSFIRFSKNKEEIILFTLNMTPTVRYDYQIGVPASGFWKEILNSDAEIYGGSGLGNMGGSQSEPIPYKDWQNSIKVTLPPLAVNIYKYEKKVEIPKPAGTSAKKRLDEVEQMYIDMETGGGD
jgi:1,4-alpha-glucan branching enzyme